MTRGLDPLQRFLTWLYEFSWQDAIASGVALLVGGAALGLAFGIDHPLGYAGNFLFSLGLFSVLVGIVWGVVAVGFARILRR